MALFNGEAENYDKWYETKMGAHVDKVETECALSLFKIEPGMHLLDVGCGTGNFSIKLAEQGASVVGVDISREMLSIARKKAEQKRLNIEFKEMDGLSLQFPDETFDGVLSMATIEFIPDYPEMILEMFRVCKKGGSILVGTINRDSSWGRLYMDREYQKKARIFQYARLRTPEELNNIKKDSLLESKECLFIPPDSPESEIGSAKEDEFSEHNSGGFFCVLWQK